MDILVKLDITSVGRPNVDYPVALPDGLTVEFCSESFQLTELMVTARNGLKMVKKKVTDRKIDLTDLCQEGELDIAVALIHRGTIVKHWSVKPILLKQVENDLSAFDAFQELVERVQALEEKTKITL